MGGCRNLLFPGSSSFCRHTGQHGRRQACPFPAGMVSLVSGEVKTVVGLIREELQSGYMPSGVDRPLSLSGSNARSLHFGIESQCCFCFHQLGPHWSPISCVLPFLGRLGPVRAEVGSGFAVVGWFRRFFPPPPPVLVHLRRPPLFFSLAFSGFARSGPGVLVLAFSPSLFFCVPPLRVPVK